MRHTIALMISILPLLLVACSKGSTANQSQATPGTSSYDRGMAYYQGTGVPQNYAQAYAWLSVAKSLGNPQAASALQTVMTKLTPDALVQAQNAASSLFTEIGALDVQRRSDVGTILNAVRQYAADNSGTLTAGIPEGHPKVICQTTLTGPACTSPSPIGINGVDLSPLLGGYLAAIPFDPSLNMTGTGTDYYIVQDAGGHVTVSASDAVRGLVSVTK